MIRWHHICKKSWIWGLHITRDAPLHSVSYFYVYVFSNRYIDHQNKQKKTTTPQNIRQNPPTKKKSCRWEYPKKKQPQPRDRLKPSDHQMIRGRELAKDQWDKKLPNLPDNWRRTVSKSPRRLEKWWGVITLLGTNISHQKSFLKMILLFPRWDMFDFLEGKSVVIGWFPSCLSPTRSSFEGRHTQSIPTSWGGGLNSIVSMGPIWGESRKQQNLCSFWGISWK